MQISQLQVAHDVVEDRLILRVATQANEEFRVFITRRFLRELWPSLTSLLSGALASAPKPPPGSAAAPAPASGFEQPFREENPNYPLGSRPLLASEAKFEGLGEGLARLTFREGRERSFNLNCNGELLQVLCTMLRSASDKAAWNLALDYGKPPGQEVPPPVASSGSSLLH